MSPHLNVLLFNGWAKLYLCDSVDEGLLLLTSLPVNSDHQETLRVKQQNKAKVNLRLNRMIKD